MTREAHTHAQRTARALRNVALGLEPDAAREVMEAAALIEQQAEQLQQDPTAGTVSDTPRAWRRRHERELGHPGDA